MIRLALTIALSLLGTAPVRADTAIVAGGYFWCLESAFEAVAVVTGVVSGYSGRDLPNPTYQGPEGHCEAVQITFDPARIGYADLIAKSLRSVDVTDAGGQFCDRGPAYRTAILAEGAAQMAAAQDAVAQAEQVLGQTIVTPVLPARRFWPAEDYHQDYHQGSTIVLTRAGPKKQSNAYSFYGTSCGRDARVKARWGPEAFSDWPGPGQVLRPDNRAFGCGAAFVGSGLHRGPDDRRQRNADDGTVSGNQGAQSGGLVVLPDG